MAGSPGAGKTEASFQLLKIPFLLDGTFAGEEQARTNITRSLKRNRYVFVIFVYQQPKRAWYFVKQRELIEGRRILKEDFELKGSDPFNCLGSSQ